MEVAGGEQAGWLQRASERSGGSYPHEEASTGIENHFCWLLLLWLSGVSMIVCAFHLFFIPLPPPPWASSHGTCVVSNLCRNTEKYFVVCLFLVL